MKLQKVAVLIGTLFLLLCVQACEEGKAGTVKPPPPPPPPPLPDLVDDEINSWLQTILIEDRTPYPFESTKHGASAIIDFEKNLELNFYLTTPEEANYPYFGPYATFSINLKGDKELFTEGEQILPHGSIQKKMKFEKGNVAGDLVTTSESFEWEEPSFEGKLIIDEFFLDEKRIEESLCAGNLAVGYIKGYVKIKAEAMLMEWPRVGEQRVSGGPYQTYFTSKFVLNIRVNNYCVE